MTAQTDWGPQLEAMCSKIKGPATVAAVRQCAKLLAVRSFRHLDRLRGELNRLETIARQFEQILDADLKALSTQLRLQQEAATACLASELRVAERQIEDLQAKLSIRDCEIARLQSACADANAARRLDADRVSALMSEDDAHAISDDERFEAQLAASVHAYRQVIASPLEAHCEFNLLSSITAYIGYIAIIDTHAHTHNASLTHTPLGGTERHSPTPHPPLLQPLTHDPAGFEAKRRGGTGGSQGRVAPPPARCAEDGGGVRGGETK